MELNRAKIPGKHEIHQHLHISLIKPRQLNWWYFRHRLKRHLSSHSFFKQTMKKKTDASYLKALEKRLLESEKENKFLWHKASLGYLTLNQALLRTGLLPLKWYPYKKPI